jgi:hypothetical protein
LHHRPPEEPQLGASPRACTATLLPQPRTLSRQSARASPPQPPPPRATRLSRGGGGAQRLTSARTAHPSRGRFWTRFRLRPPASGSTSGGARGRRGSLLLLE